MKYRVEFIANGEQQITKDYKKIRLKNGIYNAVDDAIAGIILKRLKAKIKAYENKNITASELLNYLSEHK